MDDLFTPLTAANPAAPGPRKCRRHLYDGWLADGDAINIVCSRCGKPRDAVISRRSRNNRSRGNRYELTVARSLGGVKVGHHGGPEDVTTGMFSAQTKYFAPGRFPGWMADELARLPRSQGRVPLLIIGEAGAKGVKGRAVAVLDYDDFLALHGPVTP